MSRIDVCCRSVAPLAALVHRPIALGTGPAAGIRRAPGTVTLSRAEYDRLLDLASRKPAGPSIARRWPAALTRADIRVRVDGASARATMRVDGEVFRAGMAKVPLIKGATLLDARLDNRPLPVSPKADAHVALRAPVPRRSRATLEIGQRR